MKIVNEQEYINSLTQNLNILKKYTAYNKPLIEHYNLTSAASFVQQYISNFKRQNNLETLSQLDENSAKMFNDKIMASYRVESLYKNKRFIEGTLQNSNIVISSLKILSFIPYGLSAFESITNYFPSIKKFISLKPVADEYLNPYSNSYIPELAKDYRKEIRIPARNLNNQLIPVNSEPEARPADQSEGEPLNNFLNNNFSQQARSGVHPESWTM